MEGIQFINPMLQRHFIRRWRHGFVVETGSAEPQEVGLGAERQNLGRALNQVAPLTVG